LVRIVLKVARSGQSQASRRGKLALALVPIPDFPGVGAFAAALPKSIGLEGPAAGNPRQRLTARRSAYGLLPNVLDCLAQAFGVDVLHFLPGLPGLTRLGRIPPASQFRTPLSFHFVNLIQIHTLHWRRR
jgi:hypothetical protein